MKEIKDLTSMFSYTPAGIGTKFITDESVLIEIENTSNRKVWFCFWGILSSIVLFEFFSGKENYILGTILSLVFVLIVISLTIERVFHQERFWIKSDRLVVDMKVLFTTKNRIIKRNSISKVIHIKDGSTDMDQETWALKIEHNNESTTLLHRKPYKESFWLGSLLASWAGVELTRS